MKLYEIVLLEIGGTIAPVDWKQTNNSYIGTFTYDDRLYRIDVRNIMLEPSDFKYLQTDDHSHLLIYNIGFGAWDDTNKKITLNLTGQHKPFRIFSIVQNAVADLFADHNIHPDILALSVSKLEANNTAQEHDDRVSLYTHMAHRLATKQQYANVYPNIDGPKSTSVLLSRINIPPQVLSNFSKFLYDSGQDFK